MNPRENGPNKIAEKNRKQTVLSSSFKTHSPFRFIFFDVEIQFLPCTYLVAELEPVPTNFTKYHALLSIARVDLSPPPLAVSKMFCFCFCFTLFIRFLFYSGYPCTSLFVKVTLS